MWSGRPVDQASDSFFTDVHYCCCCFRLNRSAQCFTCPQVRMIAWRRRNNRLGYPFWPPRRSRRESGLRRGCREDIRWRGEIGGPPPRLLHWGWGCLSADSARMSWNMASKPHLLTSVFHSDWVNSNYGPPDPRRIGDHYFQTCTYFCPSVTKKQCTALTQNTLQR